MLDRIQTSPTHIYEPVALGDEHYSCVVTPDGKSLSRYGDFWVNPWCDDPLLEAAGVCVYVRDRQSGRTLAVAGTKVDGQRLSPTITQHAHSVHFEVYDQLIQAALLLEVDSANCHERRTLSISHQYTEERELEIVFAIEVALAKGGDFVSHPAFSKLFVQTQWDSVCQHLSATRRPRQALERHTSVHWYLDAPVDSFETDRARFIGRGRSLADPAGLYAGLNRTVGNVLEPILVVKTRLLVPAGSTRTVVNHLRLQLPDVSLSEQWIPARSGELNAKLSRDFKLTQLYWRQRLGSVLTSTDITDTSDLAVTRTKEASVVDFAGGEFNSDGSEYSIRLNRTASGHWHCPPMPWCNVIANGAIGVIVSERGSLSTFGLNSRLYRLTPWSNDVVTDPLREWFWLKDVASGRLTSLLPGQNNNADEFSVVHGFGYTRFTTLVDGLKLDLTVSIAASEPVRLIEISIANTQSQARHLKVVGGHRWVLGGEAESPSQQLRAVRLKGVVGVCNETAGGFSGRTALLGLTGAEADYQSQDLWGFWGDRYDEPAALKHPDGLKRLTAQWQSGSDSVVPQAAILGSALSLRAQDTKRLVYVLVDADSEANARALLEKYSDLSTLDGEQDVARALWKKRVSSTQVETPDACLNPLLNGWLRYQTLSCRLLGRSAFYQSGGAFGFRDQLQDAAALAQDEPQLLREQILRNAAHQFAEGDVLHWWHTPLPVGIRTKFADDLVWLPYLLSYYLQLTGDKSILTESVAFVHARSLSEHEDELYTEVSRTATQATIYEHAKRALVRACTVGERGLPLFGCGDWNDGMNRVGIEGRGESVWMAFFLYRTIEDFAPIMASMGDVETLQTLKDFQRQYQSAVENNAWDGEWYRRGYYDNGHPLGSKLSDECQIDALAQAWSVISGLALPERAVLALDALDKHLVSEPAKIIRLLTPAFQDTAEEPGYIKGYVAGIRENGGQYTHAALWVVKAMIMAGRRDRGAHLLSLLSPLSHTKDTIAIAKYKVEPYVVAADVYGCDPHVGRGGWTWYTGSSGWMLRVAIEDVLGFQIVQGDTVRLQPNIPDHWSDVTIRHQRPNGVTVQVKLINRAGRAQQIVKTVVNGADIGISGKHCLIKLPETGQLSIDLHLG
jgi:N,N'-diacetylchitobiose phosphorylase